MNDLTNLKKRFYKLSGIFYVLFSIIFSVNAQSTTQNFPTPVTSSQINGIIKARDIGDSRLTSYFYTFNGNQGDVFINVVTENFNGDIDIFNAVNFNPLTKIVVYADGSQNETGRVIYLRKPEKLILRVQGRTPNDDPATFTIKFAGSFQPVLDVAENEQPKPPEVQRETQSDVIVNSVGTIIGVKPKPAPPETVAKAEEESKAAVEEKEVEEEIATEKISETPPEQKIEDEEKSEKKLEVVVTENIPTREEKEIAAKPEETETKIEAPVPKTRTRPARTANRTAKPEPKPVPPNPLESVRLIVLFKDGSKIERPMSEVSRVNVDNKGMLTIVSKDGTIGRYSILDVAKMTIE